MHQRDQVLRGTVLVFDQGVRDAGFGGEIFRSKFEKWFQGLLAMQSFDKILDGQRENGFLGAGGDQRVGIQCEHSQNFGKIRRRQFYSAGTDCQFIFAAGTSAAQIHQNFRAE